MAEFIIYWKDHYMDAWDADKVASLKPKEKAKYDRRLQRGDILEVHPDGDGEWRVKGNPEFIVIKVPGLAVDPDKMAPLQFQSGTDPQSGHPIYTVLKRKKWGLDVANLPTAVLNAIASTHVVSRNATQFTAIVKAKT
jgi:hypothetical protein